MDSLSRMPLNYTSLENLQDFLDSKCGAEICRPVDLGELALYAARGRIKPFRVVLDVESCLDRMYSGYFADWICGGQWNRFIEFLSNLVKTCQGAGLEIVAFFDGTVDGSHFASWVRQRSEECIRIKHIVKHVNFKATPPPKVLWVPPAYLVTAIRLSFVQLGIPIATSVSDHRLEIVSYCRQNDFSGVIGHHARLSDFRSSPVLRIAQAEVDVFWFTRLRRVSAERLCTKDWCQPQTTLCICRPHGYMS